MRNLDGGKQRDFLSYSSSQKFIEYYMIGDTNQQEACRLYVWHENKIVLEGAFSSFGKCAM